VGGDGLREVNCAGFKEGGAVRSMPGRRGITLGMVVEAQARAKSVLGTSKPRTGRGYVSLQP